MEHEEAHRPASEQRMRTEKLVTGALRIAFATTLVGACIYHDENISVLSPGYSWCAEAVNAEGWDGSDPGTDLLVRGDWPRGCYCLAPCWSAKMEEWEEDPPGEMESDYGDYVQITTAIRNAALAACNEAGNEYEFTNCVEVTEEATIFKAGASDDSDCVFEIEAGDTGGGASGAPCESMASNPGSGITCSAQGNCDIAAGVVAELWSAPEYFLGESGYGEFVTSPVAGTKLSGLVSTDLVYLLGMRNNDIVKKINNKNTTTLDQLKAALLQLQNATSFTVEIRRGTSNLTYTYDVVLI